MSKYHNFSRMHLLEKVPRDCFIKDPVHEFINFSKEQYWLYELVNTFEFQRLSRLRQLAVTYMNFPSSLNTRLAHSLGVYELCNRFTKHFLEQGYLTKEDNWKEINIALASALLHDIGHGPLSHAFENITGGVFEHEKMSTRIIASPETKINLVLRRKAKEDNLDENFYVEEVIKVLNKTSEYRWIVDLITSHIDVDRLDFLSRDSYFSGVSYGRGSDLSLFVKWSLIKDGRFLFQVKVKALLEQFKLIRTHMYADLYRNKVSVVYEQLLIKSFDYIKRNKERYVNNHDFEKIKFIFDPFEKWSLDSFLNLYDDKFLDIVENLLNTGDEEAEKLKSCLFGDNNTLSLNGYLESNPVLFENTGTRVISVELWDPDSQTLVHFEI